MFETILMGEGKRMNVYDEVTTKTLRGVNGWSVRLNTSLGLINDTCELIGPTGKSILVIRSKVKISPQMLVDDLLQMVCVLSGSAGYDLGSLTRKLEKLFE